MFINKPQILIIILTERLVQRSIGIDGHSNICNGWHKVKHSLIKHLILRGFANYSLLLCCFRKEQQINSKYEFNNCINIGKQHQRNI